MPNAAVEHDTRFYMGGNVDGHLHRAQIIHSQKCKGNADIYACV